MGCGACTQIVGTDSIAMADVPEVGLRPVFKKKLTKEENWLAISVCPGICVENGVKEDTHHHTHGTETLSTDPVVGPTVAIWVGYAADPDIRFRGSSGGVLTALSLYSLEHTDVDFVAHTKMNHREPWRNENACSSSRASVLEACGSRYAPSSPCEMVSDIIASGRKAVFVGKPCDITALTLLSRHQPVLHRCITAKLTFFCAGTPSSGAVSELAKEKIGDTLDHLTELHFRGNGWPGNFRMRTRQGELKEYYSYEQSWSKIQRHRGLRCHLCADGMGELADVSCGDAWHLYNNDGNPGVSIVIARTQRGFDLVTAAESSGYVSLQKVQEDSIISAQGTDTGIVNRRQTLWGRLITMSLLGIPRTEYSGFPLYKSWKNLPVKKKIRTILGTIKRFS
jgi:coenzyme F420 hydrogenase subunit beta